MLGFFVAFAVKLPAVPFHTWLPDAHTEAPTAGSVILAGLLLKTGAYGLLRFVVPLFPEAAREFAPIAMTLGVVGILYGAVLAFAQTDLKRLVAYTSVSHMGFVLLGIFAWNELALQGAVMQMICHGLSTGALFMLVGALQERLHTRDMRPHGRAVGDGAADGRGRPVLRHGVARAAGARQFRRRVPGPGRHLSRRQRVRDRRDARVWWYQPSTLSASSSGSFMASPGERALADFSSRHMFIMATMIVTLIWLGLYPQPVFDTAGLWPRQPAARRLGAPSGSR